jgi:hypothetical protein
MRSWLRSSLTTGVAIGIALAVVEAGVVAGPVRPVVMVTLGIVAGVVIGATWGWGSWPAALLTGASVPLRHLANRLLGLPDTTHPNTLDAVVMMGIFALAVSAAGFCAGVLMRQVVSEADG